MQQTFIMQNEILLWLYKIKGVCVCVCGGGGGGGGGGGLKAGLLRFYCMPNNKAQVCYTVLWLYGYFLFLEGSICVHRPGFHASC